MNKKNYININNELNVYQIIEYCYNRLAIHVIRSASQILRKKNTFFGELFGSSSPSGYLMKYCFYTGEVEILLFPSRDRN